MRQARAADVVRRLQSKKGEWKTQLSRIALEGVPGFAAVEIPVVSPLTVVCGVNGAGKTTILRATWAALAPADAKETVAASKRLVAGSASVDLRLEGGEGTASVTFSTESVGIVSAVEVAVTHLDSGSEAAKCQDAFCQFESAEEIVNGIGAREIDAKSLAEINFIVGRSYRSISLYEVEMGKIVPFFEVSYGDEQYDSRTMGMGEMSALYLWWSLGRAEEDSVFLIEEPEAFLSYGSQRCAAFFIIKSVVDKKLCAIVSSHSPAFISILPQDSLVYVSRGESGVSVIGDRPPPVLLKGLGVERDIMAVILVEDYAASLLARAICDRFDPGFSGSICIEPRNGDGEIVAGLKAMNGLREAPKIIGLFDGDLRDKVPDIIKDRAIFLPGGAPIEIEFRKVVSGQREKFLRELSKNGSEAILDALEGRDHHDWFTDLAKELEIHRDQLFNIIFRIWMNIPGNEMCAFWTYHQLLMSTIMVNNRSS